MLCLSRPDLGTERNDECAEGRDFVETSTSALRRWKERRDSKAKRRIFSPLNLTEKVDETSNLPYTASREHLKSPCYKVCIKKGLPGNSARVGLFPLPSDLQSCSLNFNRPLSAITRKVIFVTTTPSDTQARTSFSHKTV